MKREETTGTRKHSWGNHHLIDPTSATLRRTRTLMREKVGVGEGQGSLDFSARSPGLEGGLAMATITGSFGRALAGNCNHLPHVDVVSFGFVHHGPMYSQLLRSVRT